MRIVVRAFREHGISYSYLRDVLVKMQVGGVSTADWEARRTISREMLRACRENGVRTHPAMINSRFLVKALELLRR